MRRSAPSPAPADFAPVRLYVEDALRDEGVPSLALAVSRHGRILWEEGFGWADREERIRATPHTPYSVASVTKPLTGAALMVLVERGAVDLDAPVNRYLGEPGLRAFAGGPETAAAATVRRVGNHTAGLPLHYHFFPEDGPEPPPMEETLRRYGHLVTLPGERHRYSNLGYGVLDHLIARVSGRPYADFMRSEVFLPLGMRRSWIGRAHAPAPRPAARYGPEGARLPFYDFDHRGGSAAFASAHDLALFGAFQVGAPPPGQRAVLSRQALAETQRGTAEVQAGIAYGLGWRTGVDAAGRRRVGHTGGMAGVSTILELLPEEGLAIAVLATAATSLPGRVVDRLLAALWPEYREAAGGQAVPAPAAPAESVEEAIAGRWTGSVATYQGDLALTLDCGGPGGVRARLGGDPPTELRDARLRDGWLTGKMSGALGTDDCARRPYVLHADLRLRGGRLAGALIAVSPPEVVLGHALAHRTELRRT